MALIASLKSWAVQEVVKAADLNGNFSAIRTAFNTTAVLTDTPTTIAVSHTWSATQSFPTGSTIAGYLPLSGGTLTGSLTGTTATFSGAGSFVGLTVSGAGLSVSAGGATITGGITVPSGASTISGTTSFGAAVGVNSTLSVTSTLTAQGNFAHTGSAFGAFGATPHAKNTISGGITGTDAMAQAIGIVLQNLGLVTITNTSGTIIVS